MIKKIIININNRTKLDISKYNLSQDALTILHETELGGIVEIDLTICGEKFMRQINLKYRNIESPTDVLSFPVSQLYRGHLTKTSVPLSNDMPVHLGDIIICYPIVVKQAHANETTIEQEFRHLFKHGVKHLVGFHHK